MNKVNLRLLAGWLIANHQNLVESNSFDMGWFRGDHKGICAFVDKNNCGTVGCALGWSPVSGIKPLKTNIRDFTKGSINHGIETLTLDFDKYCERVFGIKLGNPDRQNDAYWGWCFDEQWVEFDNTPKGAAIRIMYLLNHTEEVVEWEDIGIGWYSNTSVSKYMAWWENEGKKEW